MKKENLIKVAEHLEGDDVGIFDMSNLYYCVLGHAQRVIEHRDVALGTDWSVEMSDRLFNITSGSRASGFCFASGWGTDPKAAAYRLRYVAQHGDAPSSDQWDNFYRVPAPVEAPEHEEDLVEA